ncbi:MAG: LCCL domain-containing protein [Alphaproteobacteria bacterium]|nr:LCCL domain-containing protein [Alphaproteobacteria bacterium]
MRLLLLFLLLAAPAWAQTPPCPRDATGLRADATLNCACTPEAAAQATSIWGTEFYTADSQLCRAAVHVGAITRRGGEITIRVTEGQPRHPASLRNGIRSSDSGAARLSFRFEGLPEFPQPRLCPDTMATFPRGASLTCICTGEAALRTPTVWGSGPYTADSHICRAALHAGVIPVTGGQVEVNLAEGPASHPGSMRNAVQTRDFGAFARSFAFVGPQATAPREPTQGPVAESLATQGRVSLYIHFHTGSAELEPAATPVLEQLRTALTARPEMRLQLLGHTDNQGGPTINNPLSARRAAAVRDWLGRNGVAAARITTDGRGQAEPIADNATDAGRALNRRVEAIRQD